MLAAIQSTLSGATPVYEARFRLRSNGGGYRTIVSRGKVVERGEHGTAIRMVGTMEDVSERPVETGISLADTDPAPVAERKRHWPLHRILDPGIDDGHDAMRCRRLLAAVADLLNLAAGSRRVELPGPGGGTSLPHRIT